MEFADKTVTVIGLGKSGKAAARLLKNLNARVQVSDAAEAGKQDDEFLTWARDHHVAMEFGGHTREFICSGELIVLSPGVNLSAQPVQWAQSAHLPIISEIELAYQCCPCPIIAVTGSNGKTTVSTLIAAVLKEAGEDVFLCGNVGVPFAAVVGSLKSSSVVVLEVSSFQLETIVDFKPKIGVFLNLSQNHLDWHSDLMDYFRAKKRIFLNQDKNDYAVLNAEDQHVSALKHELKSQVRFFNTPEQKKKARWNNPNFLAVQAAADIWGVAPSIFEKVISSFRGVEHRLEKVRTISDVEFVNDSKATTAEAGRWALERMSGPVVLICGGRDKHIDFSVLRDIVQKKVKAMIVIGEAGDKIRNTFADVVSIGGCATLQEAVVHAQEIARPGDCVLLSPMCASFDMFLNFEDRGKQFKDIVNNLADR